MPSFVDNRDSVDRTVVIYDTFYSADLKVNAEEFDIVYGYFTSITKSKQIAANFTSFLFRISQDSAIPVLDLLKDIQGSDNKLQMNRKICYYLNSFKSKTSLYGVGNIPRPNQSVARNVVL
jgi:hypothetical protein